jgi:hypothetical protein
MPGPRVASANLAVRFKGHGFRGEKRSRMGPILPSLPTVQRLAVQIDRFFLPEWHGQVVRLRSVFRCDRSGLLFNLTLQNQEEGRWFVLRLFLFGPSFQV